MQLEQVFLPFFPISCDDSISKRKVLQRDTASGATLCLKKSSNTQSLDFRVSAYIPTLDTLIKFPIFLTTWVVVGCCSSLDSDEKKNIILLSYIARSFPF